MKYVVLEGLDGAGKSSAMSLVINILKENGHDIYETREPGGTEIAEDLRAITKNKKYTEEISPITEAMLFYGARNQLLLNEIKPQLDLGKTIVSDNSYVRSYAYQGMSSQVKDFMSVLDKYTIDILGKPDLVIYLDVDPKVGLARARKRGELDRIEMKKIEFFEKARKNYHEFADGNKDMVISVNANLPMEDVHKQLEQKLLEHLNKKDLVKKNVKLKVRK